MLITNAKIYGLSPASLLIENGHIKKIASFIDGKADFDAKGLSLIPSFIDLNVCMKDITLDKILKLEQTAINSGLSSMLIKANVTPELMSVLNEIKFKLDIRFITKAMIKEKLAKISSLAHFGCFGFEINSSSSQLFNAISIANLSKSLVFIKIKDEIFDKFSVMNEGELSFKLGLVGTKPCLELGQIARLNEILEENPNFIFTNISLTKSLQMLNNKNKLISIHNLLKDESAIKGYNTHAKLSPVLRLESLDLSSLDLDKISLSAYHLEGHKDELCFDDADFNEAFLPSYFALLNSSKLGLQTISKLASLNPAKILGKNAGKIEENMEASFILVDEFASFKSSNLYEKDKLLGQIKAHFIKGELCFNSF